MTTNGEFHFRPRRAGKAFTLIELMIVVSIIAVLISILLPSLAAAREQAKIVKCSSQLRALGTAANYYASDQGGWVPGETGFDEVAGEGPHVLYAEVLARYLDADQGLLRAAGGDHCALSQVFTRMKVLTCPSWPGGADPDNTCAPSGGSGARRRGGAGGPSGATRPDVVITAQPLCYVVNAWDFQTEKKSLGANGFTTFADGPEPPHGAIKLTQIPRPADMIFLTEANRDNIDWRGYNFHDMWSRNHLWDSVDARMSDDLRHASGKGVALEKAKTNSLYYDGHVETARLGAVTANDFSPYQPKVPGTGGGGARRGGR